MAASSTAPLESAITPTRRASGKPTPGSCCPCWGNGPDSPRCPASTPSYRPPASLSALPQPLLGGLLTQQRTALPRQRTDHLLRQAFARLAIAAGVHAPGIHPRQQASDDRFIHRVLTGPIRTHDLSQKHRQCYRRRESAFPVFRQLGSTIPSIRESVSRLKKWLASTF